VFLGGTRLKRFMESVEKAAGSIPPPMPQQTESAPDDDATESVPSVPSSSTSPPQPQPPNWNDLLATGMSLLEKLGQTLGASRQAGQGGSPAAMVARDEATGQNYLKLPLPDGDTMRKIADLLSVFTGGK